MPVNNRSALDPRWASHHAPVPKGFMLASIRVYRKSVTDQPVNYDFDTRTYSGAGTLTVWTGNARIQPYGIIGDQLLAQDPTGRRLIRIQIADKASGIKVDDEIEITACPMNPELTNFRMEVRGTIGSSNAWLTDLVAEANVKWHNDQN